MTTIECFTCETPIRLRIMANHIPTCYRKFMLDQGLTPLCTCNSCAGKHTHPNDKPDGTFSCQSYINMNNNNRVEQPTARKRPPEEPDVIIMEQSATKKV